MNATHPGCFIVIEGVDGAGKTTIAQKLLKDLEHLSFADYRGVTYVKEPGSTPYGNGVREIFLHQDPDDPLDPMTEVLALLSCKNELMHKVVIPAVKKGWIVIADRYTRTLMAYQGGIRKVPYETLTTLLDHTNLLIPPNLEILLQIDEETQNQRRQCENTMDIAARDHAQALREGFREAPRFLPPYRSITIDATSSFDIVYEQVLDAVLKHLKFHQVSGLRLSDPVHGFVPVPAPVFVEGTPAPSPLSSSEAQEGASEDNLDLSTKDA